MATIVLTSASGSPGVTTTALALALSWPRPVLLVEADPTGGSGIHAGFFRGELDPDAGLIDLALAHRRGVLTDELPRVVRQLPDTMMSLLPGIRSHDQARSLVGLWEPLIPVLNGLRDNGQDVIVDAGRLGLAGWPAPLVMSADLTLLVTRNSLPALAGARSWASTLCTSFTNAGGEQRFGALVVDESVRWSALPAREQAGSPGVPRARCYSSGQVAKAFQTGVVATVPWDPEQASFYSHGARASRNRHGKRNASALVRAYEAAGAAIRTRLDVNEAGLLARMERSAAVGGDVR